MNDGRWRPGRWLRRRRLDQLDGAGDAVGRGRGRGGQPGRFGARVKERFSAEAVDRILVAGPDTVVEERRIERDLP